jgi:hypothetical protein
MILTKKPNRTIEIDITGPQGNAFYLMGTAQNLAKQLDLDKETIIAEMTSGDYENLLQVFDSYFGDFVTIYR